MYPWVTHMHSHLGGECQHHCRYCYVDHPRYGRAPRYCGPVRLIEDEFRVKYDERTLRRKGGTYPGVIFVEHMNDIGGPGVTREMQIAILDHCKAWPENTYVFQSKRPQGFLDLLDFETGIFPERCIIGTTIETNREIEGISDAPPPVERYKAMRNLPASLPGTRAGETHPLRCFLTIEPVLEFDVEVLADWIGQLQPDFLNLGADSKDRGLPEPTVDDIEALVIALAKLGVELREKHNLGRLRRR